MLRSLKVIKYHKSSFFFHALARIESFPIIPYKAPSINSFKNGFLKAGLVIFYVKATITIINLDR